MASTAPETSFTEMSQDDPSLIGQHCHVCRQIDFLPFRCESCKHYFCLDHRSETSHRCENAGEWLRRRREAQLLRESIGAGAPGGRTMLDVEKPCASPQCKSMIGTPLNTGVHCQNCNRDYCLKHRMLEEHDCKNLVPLGARPARFDAAAQKERALLGLNRLRAWGNAKKQELSATRVLPKAKPSSNAARIVAVNDLKKKAKGDAKIPPEKRVYLYVEAEAATTTAKLPKGAFWYSRDWVVGRVLDAAAKALSVENVNNQGMDEEEKLRVFHVEAGRLLEFNEKVGDVVVSGNTLVLLRGVGPAVPDLIQM